MQQAQQRAKAVHQHYVELAREPAEEPAAETAAS
jgi:hypothetical protein